MESIFICEFPLLLVLMFLLHTLHFRSWKATSGCFAGTFLSLIPPGDMHLLTWKFDQIPPHFEFFQASTIARGWKGRRGGDQARKYSGCPFFFKWAWKIDFCYYRDNLHIQWKDDIFSRGHVFVMVTFRLIIILQCIYRWFNSVFCWTNSKI